MKKRELIITDKEFDEKFERGEDIDKYLDLENPLKLEDILDDKKISISLSSEMKQKLKTFAKKLNLSLEDTIKVLLAKELGII